MRPPILQHGHRLRARLFMRLIRGVARQQIDPVARLALYRPQFFGDPFLTLASDVLRGPSFWTAAEREYLAVYTSRLNDCPFCVRIHSETVRLESRGAIDVNHAGSMRPQVAAVLPLLDKLTRMPTLVTNSDVEAVRAADVPDDAIIDALHVNLIFNIVNRLANAFDLTWDSDEQVRLGAKVIHRIRYRLPRILMR